MAEMCKVGRLNVRLKLKILDLYERNLSVLAIKDRLLKEDSVKFSQTTIYSFLKRHSCGILWNLDPTTKDRESRQCETERITSEMH